MNLIIAEKPMLGKAIADALPGSGTSENGVIVKGDYTIIWCFGHLLTLKDPEDYDEAYKEWSLDKLPIYFENWGHKPGKDDAKKPGMVSKAARLKQIGALLKKTDMVINAGDVDEEGSLLINEILDWFHYKGPVKRLDTSDTTRGALQKALRNMKDNALCIPDSQSAYAREVSDKIFGFNLTRYYTVQNNTLMTVGRVQTPTLGLVVMRDAQIDGHHKTIFYELFADLSLEGQRVSAKFIPQEDNPALTDGKFLDTAYLKERETSLRGNTFPSVRLTKKVMKESPPLPFNLTKLTSYCGKHWGMKPDDVMKITQSLRDNYKAITYNRSDCQYLGEEHFKEAPKTIAAAAANLGMDASAFDSSIHSRCFNDTNITAHFAIIPTNQKVDTAKLKPAELQVYTAICNFYLAQFMPPAEKEKANLEVDLGNGEFLRATGSTVVKKGYLELLGASDSEDEDEGSSNSSVLHMLAPGTYQASVAGTEIREKETKPPARYTQDSLYEDMTRIAKYVDDPEIKKLLLEKDKDKKGENGSIGTSATRGAIIKGLILKGYLEEKKQGKRDVLISTQKGRDFYNMLPDHIKKADTTARWWVIQEDIKLGKATPEDLALNVLGTVRDVISSGKGKLASAGTYANKGGAICKCPLCGGDILEGKKGYYCSNYKTCSLNGLWKQACFTTITPKDVIALVKGSVISKPYTTKSGAKGNKKLRYDIQAGKIVDCSSDPMAAKRGGTSGDILKCPVCGAPIVDRPKSFSCTNEACGFALWKESKYFTNQLKITESKARALLTGGRALFTLKSLDGKEYERYMKLEINGKYASFKPDGFPQKK